MLEARDVSFLTTSAGLARTRKYGRGLQQVHWFLLLSLQRQTYSAAVVESLGSPYARQRMQRKSSE